MRDPGLDGGRPGRCSGWWSHCCRELPPAEGRWDGTGVGGAARPPGATAGRRVQAPSTPHCWPALLGPGLTLWDHSSCMGLFGFWHILGGRGGGPRSGAAPHAWLLGLRPCASRRLRPVPTSPASACTAGRTSTFRVRRWSQGPGPKALAAPGQTPLQGPRAESGGFRAGALARGRPPGRRGRTVGTGSPGWSRRVRVLGRSCVHVTG